jgi:hypothetical protein
MEIMQEINCSNKLLYPQSYNWNMAALGKCAIAFSILFNTMARLNGRFIAKGKQQSYHQKRRP